MKKTLMLFCMLMAAFAFCACENYEDELRGEWKSSTVIMNVHKVAYQMDLQMGGTSKWVFLIEEDAEVEDVKMHAKVAVTLEGTWETHGDILTNHINETPLQYNIEEITCDDPEVNTRMQQAVTPLVKTKLAEEMEKAKELNETVAKMREALNGDDKILNVDDEYLPLDEGTLKLAGTSGWPELIFHKK